MDGTRDGGTLVHYGIKGMRWGYRKTASGESKKSGHQIKGSDDYERSRQLLQRQVKTLSNSELQVLNTRLQLEQNYSNLTGTSKNAVQRGHAQVKEVLDMAKTVNRAYEFANGPIGKAIRSAVLNAWRS